MPLRVLRDEIGRAFFSGYALAPFTQSTPLIIELLSQSLRLLGNTNMC